jgi:hypothetical protein
MELRHCSMLASQLVWRKRGTPSKFGQTNYNICRAQQLTHGAAQSNQHQSGRQTNQHITWGNPNHMPVRHCIYYVRAWMPSASQAVDSAGFATVKAPAALTSDGDATSKWFNSGPTQSWHTVRGSSPAQALVQDQAMMRCPHLPFQAQPSHSAER